ALFLANLLSVILLVQGPWWATDLLQGLANGFPLGPSIAAASACAFWILLTVTVPVIAVGTLAPDATAAVGGIRGVSVVILAFTIVRSLAGIPNPTALTGFSWVPTLLRTALMLAAGSGVLLLQYRWRRTWAARALFAAALLVGLGASWLPWSMSVRVDQLLTARSREERGAAVTFAPHAGRFRSAPGQSIDDVAERPGLGTVDVA